MTNPSKKRFWKTTPWVMAVAACYGGTAIFHFVQEYRELLAKHAWTAASILLPIAVVGTLAWSYVGVRLARAIHELLGKQEGSRQKTKAVATLLLTVAITIYFPVRIQTTRAHEQRLEQLRNEPLTEARANELFNTYDHGPESSDELRALAWNQSLPPALLSRLAEYEPSTQASVASNKSTPRDVVIRLSSSPNDLVRYYATSNPTLPRAELERLKSDSSMSVRDNAERMLKLRQD